MKFFTAPEAAEYTKSARQKIDAACESGALVAIDDKLNPRSTKRRWRITEDDLIDWHRRGRPLTPEAA